LKFKGLTWKFCQTKRIKRDIWPKAKYFDFQCIDDMYFYKCLPFMIFKEWSGILVNISNIFKWSIFLSIDGFAKLNQKMRVRRNYLEKNVQEKHNISYAS